MKIYFDTEKYSPLMSSIRGIGLWAAGLPPENGNEYIYTWRTNFGYMVKDWKNGPKTKEIGAANPIDKVYWTFLEMPETSEPIYVYFEAKPLKPEATPYAASLRLDWDEASKSVLVEKER